MHRWMALAVLMLTVDASTALAATTFFSNLGQFQDGAVNFLNTSYRYASDFLTDSTATTITGATLKVSNFDSIAHSLTASIFTDNSGVPGTLVGSFDPFTVLAGAGYADHTTSSSGISLSANTKYWEVLQMNENLVGSSPQWRSNSGDATDTGSTFTTIPSTNLKASTNDGASYSDILYFGTPLPGNFQYSLSGIATLPEPSRHLLSLAALCAMMLRRRRNSFFDF